MINKCGEKSPHTKQKIMNVEKSNKARGLSPEKLKEIEKFYHHSAYEIRNCRDEYFVTPYIGRFGIGLIIKMPLSIQVLYI